MNTSAQIRFTDFMPEGTDTENENCSPYLQQALNACANGETLYLNCNARLDDTVFTPPRIGGIVGDGMYLTILTFTKESIKNRTIDSCIIVDGANGATFRDFGLRYTGTFYKAGESYFGRANGLCILDSNDVLIERLEASGFNEAGVTFSSNSKSLCHRNAVKSCNLHHNRVAGCQAEWQEQFSAIGNSLAWNGHEADGGTGYGIEFGLETFNRNCIVSDNFTDHNYRKGISIHDGDGYTITNNRLVGDRLYSIDVAASYFPANSLLIANNVIEADPSSSQFAAAIAKNACLSS